jgi:hypothetical protein
VSTVQEIEAAILKLSETDFAELRGWIWEQDIGNDAVSGNLDYVAEEALHEHRSGKTKQL